VHGLFHLTAGAGLHGSCDSHGEGEFAGRCRKFIDAVQRDAPKPFPA
jgi:hypothetical protein